MSNLVRYGSYTPEAADSDAARVATITGNVYMELQAGENLVRFIPPKLSMPSPLRVTAMHYVDAIPGLDKKLVFACPRAELKVPCVVCAEVERLSKSPSPSDRERAYKISAGLRVYANVVDRSVPDPTQGIKVLSFGKMIHNQLKTIRSNTRLGGDWTDPTESGFDILITREGTGQKDTKYSVAAVRDASPLAGSVEEINYIIENQHDLEKQVTPIIPEELMQFLGGRTHGQVPSNYSQGGGQRVGAQVVRPAARSAVADAKASGAQPQQQVIDTTATEVAYDDDFNPR
jgi:hypothetical protein